MAKPYLDEMKRYIPKYAEDGKEIPSQFAYPMRPIEATELDDGSVRVDRDDVDEPMIYTPDTDGYAHWLATAREQVKKMTEEQFAEMLRFIENYGAMSGEKLFVPQGMYDQIVIECRARHVAVPKGVEVQKTITATQAGTPTALLEGK